MRSFANVYNIHNEISECCNASESFVINFYPRWKALLKERMKEKEGNRG